MTKYRRTFTSGEKKVSTVNEKVDFKLGEYPYTNCNVQYLKFQTFATACSIKLNDENTVHWIDTNSEFIISDIDIDKFTILDANVEYYFTAMTIV